MMLSARNYHFLAPLYNLLGCLRQGKSLYRKNIQVTSTIIDKQPSETNTYIFQSLHQQVAHRFATDAFKMVRHRHNVTSLGIMAGNYLSKGSFDIWDRHEGEDIHHRLLVRLILPALQTLCVLISRGQLWLVRLYLLHQARNNVKQVSHKIEPLTTAAPEDFNLALGEGDLRVHFRWRSSGLGSPSDVDNVSMSITCVKR
jgi:hypothetical protein